MKIDYQDECVNKTKLNKDKEKFNASIPKVSDKFDLSGIVNSICHICNKICETKTEVCEYLKEEHIENIDNDRNQPLSVLLNLAAKKSFKENYNEDIIWTYVNELLDRFEAQLKEAEGSNSYSEQLFVCIIGNLLLLFSFLTGVCVSSLPRRVRQPSLGLKYTYIYNIVWRNELGSFPQKICSINLEFFQNF